MQSEETKQKRGERDLMLQKEAGEKIQRSKIAKAEKAAPGPTFSSKPYFSTRSQHSRGMDGMD